MTQGESSRGADIRDVLMMAAEVQLAAFRAGIGFWGAWVEQATKFSEETSARLIEIKSNPAETNRLLLEIVDACRENLQEMINLPGHAAERFVEELDKFNKPTRRPKAKRPVRVKP